MAAIDDGGPTFPTSWTNEGERNQQAPNGEIVPPGRTIQLHGMTLRDYFAAQALTGDWSSQSLETGLLSPDTDQEVYDNLARMYYRMADAMLRARKVPA